ncbi:hypothetical protein COU49_02275, partial [Candidatus Nomurabacteria bacterium CG10_big_fil_rev_8_21_14_0_10_35_16]
MRLQTLELNGFKSFSQKTILSFDSPIVCIVGPNGSGKSNVVEAVRFVLGEQSMKSMRGKMGADLIFKGSKNLPKGSKASVAIYFNNSDKIFKFASDNGENINLNFDTVSISREVYGDGMNKYILNGSEVRLKDINNLLASVNIGSSGHHIISQGEADRILNANSRDRREMIEDALGLKIYQYKIKESERKLERTQNNIKEVSMLRRENAPHLNFLRKQVEKFEKTQELRNTLLVLYQEYLKKESVYLNKEKNNLDIEKEHISSQLADLSDKISTNEEMDSLGGNKKIEELKKVEQKLNEVRNIKGEISRKLGRVEGMIEGEKRRLENATEVVVISPEEVRAFVDDINNSVDIALSTNNIEEIQIVLKRIKEALSNFDKNKNSVNQDGDSQEIITLKNTQTEILKEIEEIEKQENLIKSEVEHLKSEINIAMEELRDKEREKFSLKVKHQELSSALDLIKLKEENLNRETEAFESEIKEGGVLVGSDILSYKDFSFEGEVERNIQQEQRHKIERLKIKLEDTGSANSAEIKKEFNEVSERDNFLAKELEDLEQSIVLLKQLIADLKEKIDLEFKEGIKKINKEFQEFFSLMFGGGTGSLAIVMENKKRRNPQYVSEEFESEDVEEDEEIILEPGIEINVSLPHKKVKELQALSGGERSLTSIALLFAMSQVNPPPFLILDETDAALDEANSRKYGDMLEKLSKHSQLIVVTHNRETMSRARVLYGVTINSDGTSKLLSVKFDE